MNREEFEKAASYWERKDAESVAMDSESLLKRIEKYIGAGNTCALATSHGDAVRCTPVEYGFHDGSFWIFSEGGRKFAGLGENKNVCLAIYDGYSNMGSLAGLQVTGLAEIAEPFSAEYIRAAELKNIPISALEKLPEPIHLIKIRPTCYDLLDSTLKKEGFGPRQHIEL